MIRNSCPSDIASMYAIASMSLDESYSADIFSYFLMQWPSGQLVTCRPDGTVVGFISSAKLDMSTARIMMFAVAPSYRKKGYGTMLLNAFRSRAMTEGVRTMTLEVRDRNSEAIEFYRRNGFMVSGTIPGFYNDGGDAVKMVATVQLNI